MVSFEGVWRDGAVEQACNQLVATVQETEALAIQIQQIPGPTFDEMERAQFVLEAFERLELADVDMDELGNVYGRVPGREAGPALAITAHLDTVFGREIDLAHDRQDGKLFGPGIGDNSLGVAGLLTIARPFKEQPPPRDLWLVANVGEEGLGNLRGMWAAMRRLQKVLGAVIVLEGGSYGVVIHRGIGVKRFRIEVETAGGHAWSDFGAPSAIHELCRIGTAISATTIPSHPRTSYNIGQIEGGTSINTIAARASALLDLRSEEPATLDRLVERIETILERGRRDGVAVRSQLIGERPAGTLSANHPLVQAALASLNWLGCEAPRLRASSTDANVPLAMGIPAVCIGLAVGHNTHRLNEFIELGALKHGIQHCYQVAVAALDLLGGAENR